jgi:hypothetical protein
MGEIVNPGSLSYAAEVAITPTDTAGANNLRMDGVSFRYLHNEGASAVTVAIKTATSASALFQLNSGDSLQLPHNALQVLATGTTGGAALKAFL